MTELPKDYDPGNDLHDLYSDGDDLAYERIQIYILKLQIEIVDLNLKLAEGYDLREQYDALLAAAVSFMDAFGAGEFDEPCKVLPYIRRFADAIGGQDEPDRAGYPDMDSAGGDDSMNRAYRDK